jgi:hypothetical protein
LKYSKIILVLTAVCYGLGAFVVGDANFLNWTMEVRGMVAVVWVVGVIMAPMFAAMAEDLR